MSVRYGTVHDGLERSKLESSQLIWMDCSAVLKSNGRETNQSILGPIHACIGMLYRLDPAQPQRHCWRVYLLATRLDAGRTCTCESCFVRRSNQSRGSVLDRPG